MDIQTLREAFFKCEVIYPLFARFMGRQRWEDSFKPAINAELDVMAAEQSAARQSRQKRAAAVKSGGTTLTKKPASTSGADTSDDDSASSASAGPPSPQLSTASHGSTTQSTADEANSTAPNNFSTSLSDMHTLREDAIESLAVPANTGDLIATDGDHTDTSLDDEPSEVVNDEIKRDLLPAKRTTDMPDNLETKRQKAEVAESSEHRAQIHAQGGPMAFEKIPAIWLSIHNSGVQKKGQ
jgi:hypothetical protein